MITPTSIVIIGLLGVGVFAWSVYDKKDRDRIDKVAAKNHEFLRNRCLKKIEERGESIDDWPRSADALRGDRPLTVKEVLDIMYGRGK